MEINHVDSTCHGQLDEIAKLLSKAKKIVIVTGAGISTACGIPDFRSANGLYSMVTTAHDAKAAPPKSRARAPKGKELFDSNLWTDDLCASTFCSFMASLRHKIRDIKKTSSAHKFIRQLRDRRKLVRCYTQNIDGLEVRDGLCVDLSQGTGTRGRFSARSLNLPNSPGSRSGQADGGCEVVQLHGDLAVLRCNLCLGRCAWDEQEDALLKGEAPPCAKCLEQDQRRRRHGKRGTKVGTLRPNVVLYGESHPDADMLSAIIEHDLSLSPDILLIFGTSLQVHGLRTMVREFAKSVHAKKARGRVIFVNRTSPAQSVWKGLIDHWVEMDCDGWVEDLKSRQPELFLRQSLLTSKTAKTSKPRQRRPKNALLDTTDSENIALLQQEKVEPTTEILEVADKENMEPGLWMRLSSSKIALASRPRTPEPPIHQRSDKLFQSPDSALCKASGAASVSATTPPSFPPFQLPTPSATRSSLLTTARKRKRNALDGTTAIDLSPPRWKRTKVEIEIFDEALAGVSLPTHNQ